MVRKLVSISCMALLWVAASMNAAVAQDDQAQLYDAVAPEGSAFVRVLNVTGNSVEVTLTSKINPQRVPAHQFGGYRFLPPGASNITVAGISLDMELAPDSATTVVYDGQLLLLKDDIVEEPQKAQISFYNFTDTGVALKTLDGKHAVVDTLDPSNNGTRMVNEVKVGFSAYTGENSLASYEAQLLRKGRSYSYAIFGEAGDYRSIMWANSIDATE